MKNLALNQGASEELIRAANETIHAELTTAGLEPLAIQRSTGEVPAEWLAEVDTPHGPLRFERSWRYWVVSGKVPLKLAEHLYPNKTGIRAGGHGCNVPPADEVKHYTSDGREYITVDEFHEFVISATLRRLWDSNASKYVVVFAIPEGCAFVTSYHIDTQEGLNTFVSELNAYYQPLPPGVAASDCAHKADNGMYCLRPRGHQGEHARIASVWGDDGVSRINTSTG